MNQYQVIFKDKSTEIVAAYGYTIQHGRADFDMGHGSTLTLFGVWRVEFLG